MKDRKIYRDLALVTAVFALALAIMLGVSWLQSRRSTPLQSQVLETLKELHESHPENEELASQIRQLDLLSRKAYFTEKSQLKSGVWILCGMAAILAFCLRMYYKDSRTLPGKELPAGDEWQDKTLSRRYLQWGLATGLGVLLLIILSNALQPARFFRQHEAEPLPDVDNYAVLDEETQATEPTQTIAEELEQQAVQPMQSVEAEPQQPVPSAQAAETTPQQPAQNAQASEASRPQQAVQGRPASEEARPSKEVPQVATESSVPLPVIKSRAFRGNYSSGRSSAKGIPTSWDLSSSRNVLWQTAIPRHGYNSPIVSGRKVFVTGADERARELYCFDLFSGELLWTATADNIPGSPGQMPEVNEDTGLAASTAVTNDKQVCAIFATGDLLCTDMEGRRLWARNLGTPDNHYGFASSLQIYGNLLIIQYDNNDKAELLALNVENGVEVWRRNRKDKIAWSSPVIAQVGDKPLIIVMGNPAITAYQPRDGQEVWRVDCMSGEVGASPCYANGIVYGASEYAKAVAINAEDGSVLWEADDCLPECSSPVATKECLYVATSYGAVCAYSAENGKVLRQHELETPFYSSPVIADGKVYLFSNSGKCYIFSADTRFELLNSFDTGEQTFATPAFTDSMMVVRTDKSLYVVRKKE